MNVSLLYQGNTLSHRYLNVFLPWFCVLFANTHTSENKQLFWISIINEQILRLQTYQWAYKLGQMPNFEFAAKIGIC